MPTGYTADLYEGKDVQFNEFVMKCARAFGALVEMRDEPLDAKIPDEFKPSDYHTKELAKVKQRLVEVNGWDEDKLNREAERAYQDALCQHNQSVVKAKSRKQRYETMLDKVKAWVPPTADHQNFKKFMIEQLEESVRFDCSGALKSTPPQRQSGVEYKRQLLKDIQWDIEYHIKEQKAGVERAKERTEWVRQLRRSLIAAQ